MRSQPAWLGWSIPRFTARRLASLLLFIALPVMMLLALAAGLAASVGPMSPIATSPQSSPAPYHDNSDFAASRVHNSRSQALLTPLRPGRQEDDEYAGSSWWANRKWGTVPFSSSLTMDNDRALLPPLPRRQPVYCFHDAAPDLPLDEMDAEDELLLTWRRAWWARGFLPIVLGSAEAMRHPNFAELERLQLPAVVKDDLMRWLAWHTAGGGVLMRYTVLPTATDDEPILSFLRHGQFPRLARWADLGDALFVGQEGDIAAAIQQAMHPDESQTLEMGMLDLQDGVFEINRTPAPLASYTRGVVTRKYRKVSAEFRRSRARGLGALNRLINTHLHIFWQNQFPQGIEVLKPHPRHTTILVRRALKLAFQLASCSESPMASTCPPNRPRCAPCVATAPMEVSTPEWYRNSSKVFSIGTVPHPWTLTLLDNMQETFNISWVRRESERDPWLATVTRFVLGTGASGNRRVMNLKEAIAGERATSRSLWLVAEEKMPADIDWYFGFVIPRQGMDTGRSESPVPAQRIKDRKRSRRALADYGPLPTREDIKRERPLLERARQFLAQTKPSNDSRMRAALEAWNMADTEAWKFARAFQARHALEKSKLDRASEDEYPDGKEEFR